MMKKLYQMLSPSTHMVMKIWLASVTVVSAAVLLIVLPLNLLMRQGWMDQAIEQTETNMAVTSIAIGDSYTQTLMRFVENCSTEDFQRLFSQIIEAGTDSQTSLNNSVQNTLRALTNQTSMIQASVLINRQGVCFYPLSKSVNLYALTYDLGCDTDMFSGVSLLPRQSSPVHGMHDVIPMAIPMRTLSGTKMAYIADGLEDSAAILYLFVDVDSVNSLLRTYAAQGIYGRLYLMTEQGVILNYLPEDEPWQTAAQLALPELLAAHAPGGDAGMVRLQHSFAFWHRVGDTPYMVVNLVPASALTSTLSRVAEQMTVAILVCVLLISLAAFITSFTITKPLNKLMGTVRAIEEGCYDKKMVLPQRDEIGQLSASIDSMYDTIQRQIAEIREERQAKDNAEIRLISEQINPHFLYNTLEAINMEVYSQHPENASAMIQNLGEFLRIGLSFGSKTITVGRELEHVQAYINIMNNRFNQRIMFTSMVDNACVQREVLKIILQPLVENSIRHGFRMDSQEASLGDLFISVEIHETPEGGMTMAVIDNGIGIDVAKAEQMLHADPAKQRHVGLNNVYQRLVMHYGDEARITFSSIPYFRNTVCIHLPPHAEEGAER